MTDTPPTPPTPTPPTPMPMPMPDPLPKTIAVPFGLVLEVAQYLEATPTARDVPPSTPVGMALQLSQHAEAAIQRHKAVQGKKLKEEMERLADEKKNSGHVPRKPMDELMAEAKSARASPTPKE